MTLKINWYGHACFLIETDGTKLLTDPFITRITSYNVCYTKLLRPEQRPAFPASHEISPPDESPWHLRCPHCPSCLFFSIIVFYIQLYYC